MAKGNLVKDQYIDLDDYFLPLNFLLLMNPAQLQEGLAYTEKNYTSADGFSKLDKEIIESRFDLRGKDVLEFGCGMGHMSLWLSLHMGAVVDAVDIDENHITVAKKFASRFDAPQLSFSLVNIIAEPIDKQYDFIFLNDVIEHIRLDWIENVLDTLVLRNLKPGGVIFFSYPPWEGPHASHLQPITRIPWVQFMPDSFIMNIFKKRNPQLVGKHDLRTEYLELNHMTNRLLQRLMSKYPVKQIFRKSHTKLNRLAPIRNINFNFLFFKLLVTKELVAFRRNA